MSLSAPSAYQCRRGEAAEEVRYSLPTVEEVAWEEEEGSRRISAVSLQQRKGKERDMGGGWPWDISNAADHGCLSVRASEEEVVPHCVLKWNK